MNSESGSFQGSCRWVASPPNFFGFKPSSRAIWICRSLRCNRRWASAQASRRALGFFTTSPFPSRRVVAMRNAQGLIRASDTRPVVHRVHHAVPMRLSLPCRRKDTTEHGGPSTRGRRPQPATAGAPAASGAGWQSAPQSADRSARWLIRRRHRAAPALCGAANPLAGPAWLAAVARARLVEKVLPVCAAARGPVSAAAETPSARQRARTDAAPCLPSLPPRGLRRKAPAPLRSARATGSYHPSTPSSGLCGSLTLLEVSGDAAPTGSCGGSPRRSERPPNTGVALLRYAGSLGLHLSLCGLSSLLARLRNVLPQDSCVKARPRCVHQEDGHRGLAASESKRACQAGFGIGGARLQALRVQRDRRRTRVPDEAQAWAGVQRGGSVPPHPSQVAALRCRSNGLLLPGCVLPGTRGRSRAPSPDRLPWPRGPWRWPAPGSRVRLPIAAALFLPPQDAQCNPGGATSRAGLAALGAPAHPGHGLLRQDWGSAGRRKKKNKCRSNRPRRGQGPYRMFYSPPPRHDLAVRGEHRHPQVHRCSTQPSEKPLGSRPLKLLKT